MFLHRNRQQGGSFITPSDGIDSESEHRGKPIESCQRRFSVSMRSIAEKGTPEIEI